MGAPGERTWTRRDRCRALCRVIMSQLEQLAATWGCPCSYAVGLPMPAGVCGCVCHPFLATLVPYVTCRLSAYADKQRGKINSSSCTVHSLHFFAALHRACVRRRSVLIAIKPSEEGSNGHECKKCSSALSEDCMRCCFVINERPVVLLRI